MTIGGLSAGDLFLLEEDAGAGDLYLKEGEPAKVRRVAFRSGDRWRPYIGVQRLTLGQRQACVRVELEVR